MITWHGWIVRFVSFSAAFSLVHKLLPLVYRRGEFVTIDGELLRTWLWGGTPFCFLLAGILLGWLLMHFAVRRSGLAMVGAAGAVAAFPFTFWVYPY